jgi:tetratricopeptide (TPR) repeat protein
MRITTLIVLTFTLCILNSGCNSESSTTEVNGPVDSNSESFTDAISYNNRGDAYYQQGELDKAIADYSKAIELDPAYASAYYYRGIVFEKLGGVVQAEADYGKAKELGYEP